MKDPEQLYLSDNMEPPPDPTRTPELDAVVMAAVDATDEQKQVTANAKHKREAALAALLAANVEKYPFVDRTTGKKRYFVADRTARAKTVSAPKVRTPRTSKRKKKKSEQDAETVEHRKVSRESVEREIGPLDPFASTRAAMEGGAS